MIVPPEGLVLNVFKPAGITSFGVVSRIRRRLGVKKVGHAGTLDPMAEGVLLILVGKATKKAGELSSLDKVYQAGILLGVSTDTYDITGNVSDNKNPELIERSDIETLLAEFTGEIEQVPPMFSALKVDGERLYKIARKGVVLDRKARRVIIQAINLDYWDNPHLMITVRCSKGTYIRSLAHDLGERLGCGACLESLLRTAVGEYRVENSLKIEDVRRD